MCWLQDAEGKDCEAYLVPSDYAEDLPEEWRSQVRSSDLVDMWHGSVPPLYEGQETFCRVTRPEESVSAGREPHVLCSVKAGQWSAAKRTPSAPLMFLAQRSAAAPQGRSWPPGFPGSWTPSCRGILPAHLYA